MLFPDAVFLTMCLNQWYQVFPFWLAGYLCRHINKRAGSLSFLWMLAAGRFSRWGNIVMDKTQRKNILRNGLVEYFMFKLWCTKLTLFQWTFRGQYMDSELKMLFFLSHISVNSPGSLRADAARTRSFLSLLPSSELTILNLEISRRWAHHHTLSQWCWQY